MRSAFPPLVPNQQPTTVDDAFRWCWNTHWVNSPSASPVYSMLLALRELDPKLGSITLENLDRPYIQRLLDSMRRRGDKPSTVRRKIYLLIRALGECHANGWLHHMPAMPSIPSGSSGRIRTVSSHEFEVLTRTMSALHRDLCSFLMYTGLRVGEALALMWKNIKLGEDAHAKASVYVIKSKTGKARTVPIATEIWEMLHEYRRSATAQELDGAGPFTKVDYKAFSKEWLRCRTRVLNVDDEDLVPHALRHTFASHLINSGASLPVVQNLMGHSTLAATSVYLHLDAESGRNAVAQIGKRVREAQ